MSGEQHKHVARRNNDLGYDQKKGCFKLVQQRYKEERQRLFLRRGRGRQNSDIDLASSPHMINVC